MKRGTSEGKEALESCPSGKKEEAKGRGRPQTRLSAPPGLS